MAFNHYAKVKRILDGQTGWIVVRVDEPTVAKSFKGEARKFDHYYRIYDRHLKPIKYCKFQQIQRFNSVMGLQSEGVDVMSFDEIRQFTKDK